MYMKLSSCVTDLLQVSLAKTLLNSLYERIPLISLKKSNTTIPLDDTTNDFVPKLPPVRIASWRRSHSAFNVGIFNEPFTEILSVIKESVARS